MVLISCFESDEGSEPYSGPTTMIDDFEDGDFDIIEQMGRAGHWVPIMFPHPIDDHRDP